MIEVNRRIKTIVARIVVDHFYTLALRPGFEPLIADLNANATACSPTEHWIGGEYF